MRKTALLTGGSSGIGRCIATQLAARGYDLVIVSIENEKNIQLARQIHDEFGVDVYPVFKDLCSPSAARELYDFCHENTLHIDILVNNAGILSFGTLSRTPAEKIERITALHVSTPAMLCKLFSEDMKQRGEGRILITSSATARMPYPTISVYAATKSFLRSFAYSLRFELRQYGIFVTTVMPGAVDTPLYDLPDRTRRILCSCGIMMPARKVAEGAVKAMFAGRKSYIPGMFTRLTLALTAIIPDGVIFLLMRHPKLEHLFK